MGGGLGTTPTTAWVSSWWCVDDARVPSPTVFGADVAAATSCITVPPLTSSSLASPSPSSPTAAAAPPPASAPVLAPPSSTPEVASSPAPSVASSAASSKATSSPFSAPHSTAAWSTYALGSQPFTGEGSPVCRLLDSMPSHHSSWLASKITRRSPARKLSSPSFGSPAKSYSAHAMPYLHMQRGKRTGKRQQHNKQTHRGSVDPILPFNSVRTACRRL